MKLEKLYINRCLGIIIFTLYCFFPAIGQQNVTTNWSADGLLEDVSDRFGNHYKLSEILVNDTLREKSGGSNVRTSRLCVSSGYFDLYFEDGALGPISTPIATINSRRDVFCQVFSDLSDFIFSPLTSNGRRVNIWIRNITSLTNSPNALGAATDLYIFPPDNSNIGGIIDGQVWKTINSGVDAYTNVASPLS